MGAHFSDDLMKTWLAGWALCRGYELQDDGRTVSVSLTDHDNEREHFLWEPPAERFLTLAEETREEPDRLLTVVTTRMYELLEAARPLGMRVVEAEQSLMYVDMDEQDVEDPLPPDEIFSLQHIREPGCRRVVVLANGEEAARGSVAVQGDYAVFDRIVTVPRYRRRGLGSYVMRALTAAALEDYPRTGLLMASADGGHLYQYLGWTHLANAFVIRK